MGLLQCRRRTSPVPGEPGGPSSLASLSELCPERCRASHVHSNGTLFVCILLITSQMEMLVFMAHGCFSVWTVVGPVGGVQVFG